MQTEMYQTREKAAEHERLLISCLFNFRDQAVAKGRKKSVDNLS